MRAVAGGRRPGGGRSRVRRNPRPRDPALTQTLLSRPIANCTLAVVDPGLAPRAFGRTGELAIGGVPLATGYLGDPEAPGRAFVAAPAWTGVQRLYLIGDLVRQTAEGLEYLGSRDSQVKIRGQRVELTAVEDALQDLPGAVRRAARSPEDARGAGCGRRPPRSWPRLAREPRLARGDGLRADRPRDRLPRQRRPQPEPGPPAAAVMGCVFLLTLLFIRETRGAAAARAAAAPFVGARPARRLPDGAAGPGLRQVPARRNPDRHDRTADHVLHERARRGRLPARADASARRPARPGQRRAHGRSAAGAGHRPGVRHGARREGLRAAPAPAAHPTAGSACSRRATWFWLSRSTRGC